MINAVRGRTKYAGKVDPKLYSTYPKDHENLLTWYDASKVSGADADPIQTLSDLSGNGYNATQATEASRPLLKTSIINGLSVLRFDGSNDVLVTGNIFFGMKTTQFYVIQFLSNGSDPGFINTGNMGNAQGYSWYRVTSSGKITNWGENTTSAAVALNTPVLISHVNRDLSNKLYRDGVLDSTYTSATRLIGTTTYRFGGYNAPAGLGYGNFDLAELITYDRALLDGERQAIERYLMSKWGIA